MAKFLIYFLLFIIYACIGWAVDVIGTFIGNKKIINRGFLIGPYCPIYGVAGLIMGFTLARYESDPLVLFIMSTLICSVIEYITSYVMEKIFHTRWWDYSHERFNLNGRICLSCSVLFGALGLLVVYFIHPFMLNLLYQIPYGILMIIGLVMLILFVTDIVISSVIISKFMATYNITMKDCTEEISKKVKEILNNRGKLTQRLNKAFPNWEATTKKIID